MRILFECKQEEFGILIIMAKVGIEVHELPWVSIGVDRKIQPGMVFSVEPGIYIPKVGGVRIEDLVAVEKNGI